MQIIGRLSKSKSERKRYADGHDTINGFNVKISFNSKGYSVRNPIRSKFGLLNFTKYLYTQFCINLELSSSLTDMRSTKEITAKTTTKVYIF